MTSKSFPYGRFIYFVTGNIHKYFEARQILAEFNIASAMLKIKVSEIQDDDVENVAKTSAKEAAKTSGLPIIVEDAGLFIEALNGFPGPYSKFVYNTIGLKGVLRLLGNEQKRAAYFKSVVAFCDSEGTVETFSGIVEGIIANKIRGTSGFGFDPIFEPKGKLGKTFGEMSIEEKSSISHRSQALRKFAKWYRKNFQS
ncbi:XTP/dITP diphosphatase [Candidatus Bathyarchaeota archaeon]|nr:XTP/dITP diphosphatase [Candidatus Bathyarchaeota archaeon]